MDDQNDLIQESFDIGWNAEQDMAAEQTAHSAATLRD
jgi:hypothetical protein